MAGIRAMPGAIRTEAGDMDITRGTIVLHPTLMAGGMEATAMEDTMEDMDLITDMDIVTTAMEMATVDTMEVKVRAMAQATKGLIDITELPIAPDSV
jgi:hypothetical protein